MSNTVIFYFLYIFCDISIHLHVFRYYYYFTKDLMIWITVYKNQRYDIYLLY